MGNLYIETETQKIKAKPIHNSNTSRLLKKIYQIYSNVSNKTLILEKICLQICLFTKSEMSTFLYLHESKLVCVGLAKTKQELFDSISHTDSKSMESIFGKSLQNNIVYVSKDCSKDSRFVCDIPEGHPHVSSIVMFPLRFQSKKIGIVSVANSSVYSIRKINEINTCLPILAEILNRLTMQEDTILSQIQQQQFLKYSKDKFLASMSHELRTPLNGILGMVTIFPSAGELNTKQREYLTTLNECTLQLGNLLNNILDFSKMASGNLSLKSEPIDISDIFSKSIEMIRGKLLSKEITFETDFPSSVPKVLGDSQRLIQVFTNLLSNSVKFTEKGKITFRCSVVFEKETEILILFEITDTGIGIPLEEQEDIFENFCQGKKLDTFQTNSGTGLGLSISKEILKLMKSEIRVESGGQGKGSTFSFEIQFPKYFDPLQLSREKNLIGKKILVVDDREEYRIQLLSILFSWNCIPTPVTSGEEAISYLRHGMVFDCILIDICMPNMSGIELATEIRKKYSTPIIGISSVDLENGKIFFDEYMNKPISEYELLIKISSVISKPKNTKPISMQKIRKTKENLRILIVEDDEYNLYTLLEMLYSLGYKKIDSAKNGKRAVEKVNKRLNKGKQYDIVLMDIIMPIMDGVEATKKIKQHVNPPTVIGVSAAVSEYDRTRCQYAGIDSYLNKPISKQKLEELLTVFCSSPRQNKIV